MNERIFLILFISFFIAAEKPKYEISYGNENIYNDDSNITGKKTSDTGQGDDSDVNFDNQANKLEVIQEKIANKVGDTAQNIPSMIQNQNLQIFNQNPVQNKIDPNSIAPNVDKIIEPSNEKNIKQDNTKSDVIDFNKERQKSINDSDWRKKQGNVYDPKGSGVVNKATTPPIKNEPIKMLDITDDASKKAQDELQKRLKNTKGIVLTKQQIDAFGSPSPILNRENDTKIQRRPSNIAKRIYNKPNRHLTSIWFPADYALNAFKIISDKDFSRSDFQALMNYLENPSILDNLGNNMLMYSINQKNYVITMYLINRGVNINQLNTFGIAPIHLASYVADHIATVSLIEAGGDVNLRDGNGNTALMYVALSGDVNLAKRLIDFGAELDIKNKHNLDVMDFAYNSGNLNMVNYLVKKGLSLLKEKELFAKQDLTDEQLQTIKGEKFILEYKRIIDKSEYFYYSS